MKQIKSNTNLILKNLQTERNNVQQNKLHMKFLQTTRGTKGHKQILSDSSDVNLMTINRKLIQSPSKELDEEQGYNIISMNI